MHTIEPAARKLRHNLPCTAPCDREPAGWRGALRRVGVAAAGMVLAACAATPAVPPPQGVFDDALFGAPGALTRADEVFALSEAMKRHVEFEIAAPLRLRGPQRGLVDALHTSGQLKLEYDTQLTRTAAQAFDARSGNCLSLVIMTAALAKHLGIPVSYHSVISEAAWSRSGDLYFSSGHVNLSLGEKLGEQVRWARSEWRLTIDFLPPEDLRGQRAIGIGEDTIVAMFMNNRAAESLALGRLDDAYHYARAAIRHAPAYLTAYNTLGVIYLRAGHPAHADRVFAQLLAREPGNTLAMGNHVRALRALGRHDDAGALARQLAQVEPHPPFHFFDQGLAAMREGDWHRARELFAREVQRAAYYHEFHFWLAEANLRLGDVARAREHMSLAEENGTTRRERALYGAKLAQLRARRVQ